MTMKRLILLIVVVVLVGACLKKAKSDRESEWHGLTESEARDKLDAKLPGHIPADKRSAISDKVVGAMRDRGVIVENPVVADVQAEVPQN